MSPDLRRPRRWASGVLLGALLAAAAGSAAAWHARHEAAQALERAAAEAARIAGPEPLAERVQRQRAANEELRQVLARLKGGYGFRRRPEFVVPEAEPEKGKFFLNRFVEVRQRLREQAQARRIESDERLGFPPDDRVPPDSEAQALLDMLQLTDKALSVVLAAPDPVEWFEIKHGKPYETGPLSRPPLLRELPLTLRVRGSHKTILWILHRFGRTAEDDFPLIIRGLAISSRNQRARDDIAQLDATFELAALDFIPETQRQGEAGPRRPALRSRP
ncbi:MAG: hypothetical protein RMM29_02595 [Planctomycetota bacterium]|nr:hypothetical protein [Planctomycetota bacterium]MCX8040182.1 hypothetical protein [Planctomycetota bacterium]MDW8372523.1 hypothetical protein [Planctomycetota bacterium]